MHARVPLFVITIGVVASSFATDSHAQQWDDLEKHSRDAS